MQTGNETPTEEYFQFEDLTGALHIYTEAQIRAVGCFHRHGALPGLAVRSDGSTASIAMRCPICEGPGKAWPEAWRSRRVWPVTFEALGVVRRIEGEYEQSAIAMGPAFGDVPYRVVGLSEGSPPEAAA